MDNTKAWHEYTYVAFDTETSGAFPIGFDICEVGLVKWKNGQIIDEYQSLVKPREAMGEKVIKIHGITNDMVETAPKMEDIISIIHNFIGDSVLLAHHAPFDLGFLAYDFEKYDYSLPKTPALCTSLLSRKLFPNSPNHRLQTLIKYFELEQGTAHRALDDAKACLEVGLRCLKSLDENTPLASFYKCQEKNLAWEQFSINKIKENDAHNFLVEAIEEKKNVIIDYKKEKSVSKDRVLKPIGIVRNPDGDFLQAHCLRDFKEKRFYLSRIVKVQKEMT